MKYLAVARFLLIAGFAGVFVVVSNLWLPMIDGKMILYRGVAFLALASVVVGCFFDESVLLRCKESFRNLFSDTMFLALFASTIFLIGSTLFAYDRELAYFGEAQRAEGFLTLAFLFVLYTLFRVVFDRTAWQRAFSVVSAATIILCGMQLVQLAQGADRPSASVGNPVFLSAYYLSSIVASYVLVRMARTTREAWLAWLGYGGLVAGIFGLLMTKTRGSLLGAFAALVFVALGVILFGKKHGVGLRTRKILGTIFFAGVALCVVFVSTRQSALWSDVPLFSRFATISLSSGSAYSRIQYAKIGINGWLSDPSPKRILFGYGWDNYVYVWMKHYDPTIYFADQNIADRSHNRFVDTLVMSGVLGLAAYCVLWFGFFRQAALRVRQDFFLGLVFVGWGIAYLIQNLFSFDAIPTYYSLFAVLAAVSFDRYLYEK